MNFNESPEFAKDVKRLIKKWRSIPSDIQAAKQYIVPLYDQLAPDVDVAEYRRQFFAGKTAAVLHSKGDAEVVKMRLDVADLGHNDKARIVFIAVISENRVLFVELYAKNEKSREDQSRIKRYL